MDREGDSFSSAISSYQRDPLPDYSLPASIILSPAYSPLANLDYVDLSPPPCSSPHSTTDNNDTGSVLSNDSIASQSLRLSGTTILQLEFDPTVLPLFTNHPTIYATSTCSDTTASTIYDREIWDTVVQPVPTSYYQRLKYYSHTINNYGYVPPTYIIVPPLITDLTDFYYPSQRNLTTIDPLNPERRLFAGSIRNNPYQLGIDKCSKDYTGTKYTHVTEGLNCYSVQVAGNKSLVVNHRVGSVCFGEATTYYSSYEHTFKNPDKCPAFRKQSDYKLLLYNHSRVLYYVKSKKRIQYKGKDYYRVHYSEYRRTVTPRTRRFNSPLVLDPDWKKPCQIIPTDRTITEVCNSDPTIKDIKFIHPRPKVIPYYSHPYCIGTNYPLFAFLHRQFGSSTFRDYTLPTSHWFYKPAFARTLAERQSALNWLYETLMKKWAP